MTQRRPHKDKRDEPSLNPRNETLVFFDKNLIIIIATFIGVIIIIAVIICLFYFAEYRKELLDWLKNIGTMAIGLICGNYLGQKEKK